MMKAPWECGSRVVAKGAITYGEMAIGRKREILPNRAPGNAPFEEGVEISPPYPILEKEGGGGRDHAPTGLRGAAMARFLGRTFHFDMTRVTFSGSPFPTSISIAV